MILDHGFVKHIVFMFLLLLNLQNKFYSVLVQLIQHYNELTVNLDMYLKLIINVDMLLVIVVQIIGFI